MSDAIVVGSGPNGLAAAVELARNGVGVTVLEAEDRIGGGTRTSELTVPGLLHDDCSATHPMAAGSPFLNSLDLGKHGLEWLFAEIDLAHPLDDGSAGVMVHSIDETTRGLGEDGPAWRRVFGSSSAHFEDLLEDMLTPIIHLPKHPLRLARFGIPAAAPASVLARSFKTSQARALFGGVAAHAFAPLSRPMSSSVGCALIDACHAFGWPVAKGGSRAITDALASVLREHGGRIETGQRVTSSTDLTGVDALVFDHVAGTFEQIAIAERAINRGEMPERPFVLVGQQYLADPSRSVGDLHPVWIYAHVPSGYTGDATESILGQIERLAPGFRERITATSVRTPADLEAYNSNYVGGDIITGANSPVQVLFRPRLALDPYSTGIRGVYICSAATPPGAGAHGMNGYNAARSALRNLA